jgi:hypothetical protein
MEQSMESMDRQLGQRMTDDFRHREAYNSANRYRPSQDWI